MHRFVAMDHISNSAAFITKPVAKNILSLEHFVTVLANYVRGCMTE
jgi:hypothetical protein